MLRATFAWAFVMSVGTSAWAADTKTECLASYVRAQELRNAGSLIAAQKALLTCAQTQCPQAIASECTVWLQDLEQRLPSIVVSVRDDTGAERTDANVLVDGARVRDTIDGRAIVIDPGGHEVKVELADGRMQSTKMVAKEGERLRRIELTLTRRDSVTSSSAPPRASSRATVPTATWALGGVAVGAAAVAGVFWSWGWWGSPGKASLDECAPHCEPRAVDGVKQKLLVGNVALAVSGAAALAAAVVFVTHRISVGPADGAIGARAKVSF